MKHQLTKILFLISMLILAGLGCSKNTFIDQNTMKPENDSYGVVGKREEVIGYRFVPDTDFARTVLIRPKEIEGYPFAGIVNHHSLAMDIQARFFKSLQKARPEIDKFIVISPDHFLAGDLVSTHGFAYATPAGEVKSWALKAQGVFEVKDIKVFEKEHGVGALAPFITREFPGAVIVPVYIRPEASRDQLRGLGEAIAELADERTFVILSSDMSHYLTDEQARENDKLTISWIENMKWENLQTASDDYTDSAKGFVVLEAMFESLEKDERFELIDYAVSTDYGADPNETTSYVNGFYLLFNF